ncbi:hypothetical protein [Phreatobacter cathodiphilus]|uniref:hypothetical protein n=1 Tax=Phreatobacter cathodiphilus TaxID=1868589 RepID=UPI0015E7A947|nr:hypothetical protein [Phreatobacter cathodiphilus]
MKTATAAPIALPKPASEPLEDRYRTIGISAVAAAAPFIKARKPAPAPRTGDYPLSMD